MSNNAQSSVDPNGLLEYSVVYTDRSLNHMSQSFQGVMNEISATLKSVYKASTVVVVPGSGTFAMEAVARQFAKDKHCLVIRNGWFSFRWTQIFDKPAVVFAPHVETSAGMMLPNDYLRQVADAVHSVGGIFVLDCIASGTIWVDMQEVGVDVLVSAPQKGWSGSPCSGLVMLNERATELLATTQSDSFACDLKKWHDIMQAYEAGGHAYHATMPTDGLVKFNQAMQETAEFGFDKAHAAQQELGDKVRALLTSKGIPVCHCNAMSEMIFKPFVLVYSVSINCMMLMQPLRVLKKRLISYSDLSLALWSCKVLGI